MFAKLAASKIAQNAGWLMILQLSSYAVPLLLLPYLTRVLGLEAFGELAIAWAVLAYAGIFADFGFYLWGVRECAVNEGDNNKLSTLYSAAILIKSALLGICLFVMIFTAKLADSSVLLYLFLWVALVGQSLMPGWLYQGKQNSFWFLLFNICAQAVSAVLTVILVSKSADLVFVGFSAAFSWGLFALLANIHAKKTYSLSFVLPSFEYLRYALKSAFPLFSANIWVAFYINLPALAVGFLSTRADTAVFTGAQKIVLAIQALFTPISSAVFPRISALALSDARGGAVFFKKIILFTLPVMFAVSALLFGLSDFIVSLAFGTGFEQASLLLRIMSIGPTIVAANMLLANHYIVAFGYASRLTPVYATTAVIALILAFALVPSLGAMGAGMLYVFVEIAVLCGLLLTASKISPR